MSERSHTSRTNSTGTQLLGAFYAQILVVLALLSFSPSAKAEVVSVTGQGPTVKEATTEALRSAVEQQVGLLVRSTTQVSNARAVSDQVITLTHGFVNGYRITSKAGPDTAGQYHVTVEADIDRQLIESTVSGVTRQQISPSLAENLRLHREQLQSAQRLARALVAEYVREVSFGLPKYRVYEVAEREKPIVLEFDDPVLAEVPETWRKEFDALLAIAGDPTDLNTPTTDVPSNNQAVVRPSAPSQLLVVHRWSGEWKGYWVDPTLVGYVRSLLETVRIGFRVLDRKGATLATLDLGPIRQEISAWQGGDLDLSVWTNFRVSRLQFRLTQGLVDQAGAFEMFAYWPSR